MLPSRELPARNAAVLVAAVALLALAVGGALALGLIGGSASPLDQVPDRADVVAEVDPAIADDERTRTLVDAGLDAVGVQPSDGEGLLSTAEARTGLDARAVESVVAYGRYDAAGRLRPRYGAAIVRADWSTEAVVDAFASVAGTTYSRSDAGEATVYRPGSEPARRAPAIAVLDDGEFVLGTELAVEDAVAVANGDAEAVDGPLKGTFAATERGLVTVAARVPRERFDGLSDRMQELTRLESVRVVAGAYDATADGIEFRGRLRTNGTEAARDVTDLARGSLPLASGRLDNDTAAAMVESIEVERDGRDVRLALRTTTSELRRVAARYGFETAVDRVEAP